MLTDETVLPDVASLTLMMNSVVARVARETFKDISDLGLNMQSARVLILLLERTCLRCSALSRDVGIEATALSHLLRVMAEQGLVTRERVKEDNRAVEVRLTQKGRNLARSCRAVDLDKQRVLLNGMEPKDVERLSALLSRMSENLNDPRLRNSG